MREEQLEHAFRQPHYLELNRARLEHLAWMLDKFDVKPTGKTVVDLGAGIGDLAVWWEGRGALVTCLDAREDNVRYMEGRGLTAYVVDFDHPSYSPFGKRNIVFAYGILYHLATPVHALEAWKSIADEMLLLETMIDPAGPFHAEEDRSDPSQGVSGRGFRPSLDWIRSQFEDSLWQVIVPDQPKHPDYASGRRVVLVAKRK